MKEKGFAMERTVTRQSCGSITQFCKLCRGRTVFMRAHNTDLEVRVTRQQARAVLRRYWQQGGRSIVVEMGESIYADEPATIHVKFQLLI